MRSGTTVLLGLAGLAWTTGQAVLPDVGATIEERYARVADAPTLQALSVGLLFTAGGLLVLGSLSAARHVPQGPGRRLVAVGVRLTALGGLWLAAGRAMFNRQFLMLTDANIPREAALRLLEASLSPALIPLALTLPCLLLGPVLVGVGIVRARTGSWLIVTLWALGIGLFVATEFGIKATEVIGIAVAAVALTMMGRALTRIEAPDLRADT
jgi:hypothetical protein